MQKIVSNERGIALAVAIFALVVVGALVAGALFAGTQEQRVGENVRRATQSFGVAEGGVFDLVRNWDPQNINNRRWFPADTVHVPDMTKLAGVGVYGGSIFKLNRNLYLVDVTGSDSASRFGGMTRQGGARQRIGMLMRVKPVQVDVRAGLTTQGRVTLVGQSYVNGYVTVPPNWTSCDTIADTAKAGVRVPNDTLVKAQPGTVAGQPAVMGDATVADSTFTKFGDVTWDQLVARATRTLPGGNYSTQPRLNADGTCDKSDTFNWGDGISRGISWNDCSSYFPIVHITGSVILNNTQGQGILLVDGNLEVQGSYQFFGITIVKGAVKVSGGGTAAAHFWGAVLAQNVDLQTTKGAGRSEINYSKCAILQALQNSGMVTPMRSRAWAQLF